MMSSKRFSHLDRAGAARMVDVSAKRSSLREARAGACVRMSAGTLKALVEGAHAKGDVLAAARIAGIQAAKRCAELIPLCHSLPLEAAEVELKPVVEDGCLQIEARCRTRARTGVEMEALCAVSVAALTVYDMCKSAERGMVIDAIRLLEKKGGRSGRWQRD